MARKKPKSVVPTAEDGQEILTSTRERRRQYGDEAARFKTDTGRVIERLSVIDSLYERDEISPEGYLSAVRYAADYYIGFNTRITANLSNDVVDGSGSADNFNAKRIDAQRRFTDASQALPQESRHVLSHIVLGDLSMTQYSIQYLNSVPRSKSAGQRAKAILVRAINRLASHYGSSTSPAKPRSRTYMAEGGKPVIHPFHQDDFA